MNVTVDISENEFRDIRKYTGENMKGPAILKKVVNAFTWRLRADLQQ